jgi:hypothetical protein
MLLVEVVGTQHVLAVCPSSGLYIYSRIASL